MPRYAARDAYAYDKSVDNADAARRPSTCSQHAFEAWQAGDKLRNISFCTSLA